MIAEILLLAPCRSPGIGKDWQFAPVPAEVAQLPKTA
jgi:hypothetical protein